MLKRTMMTAALAACLASNAGAATLNAVFETDPFLELREVSENINDVISLTATDLAGGGVELVLTANNTSEGFGSFYIAGFDPSDFVSTQGRLVEPSEFNSYRLELGAGTVFGRADLGQDDMPTFFNSGSISFFTQPGSAFTTDDFLTASIGAISVVPEFPGSLGAAYRGNFVTDVSTIPLPASLPLLAGALLGAGWLGRRSRKTT